MLNIWGRPPLRGSTNKYVGPSSFSCTCSSPSSGGSSLVYLITTNWPTTVFSQATRFLDMRPSSRNLGFREPGR
jgi:hypothetical protein